MPLALLENGNTGDKSVSGCPVIRLRIGWLQADQLEACELATLAMNTGNEAFEPASAKLTGKKPKRATYKPNNAQRASYPNGVASERLGQRWKVWRIAVLVFANEWLV